MAASKLRSFKGDTPFEKRLNESTRIRAKYPERVPVIVERAETSKTVPDIDRNKYLVPSDLTMGQFIYIIRKRIQLGAEKAIFIFIDNKLPPTACLMSMAYEELKDHDGFLYIKYSGENTFGGSARQGTQLCLQAHDTEHLTGG